MKKSYIFLIALLFIGSHIVSAGTISFDQLAVSSDLTVTKWNSDMDRVYQKVNSNIQTDNIAADTILESDCGDDMNPRIRTAENASCVDLVYTGLLPTTTTGTLTGSVPAGTVYPLGYRVVKSSPTPKTFDASKWTWVDIDVNGDFTYPTSAIGGATPAVSPNSTRLARVSTDPTEVSEVTDLRKTSCTAGPFDIISDSAGEASLEDLFSVGTPVRRHYRGEATPQGYAAGSYVSWDGVSNSFKVLKGSLYINGKYRRISQDLTVPATADDPLQGTSGIVSGSLAADTNYNVYAVADLDGVKNYSVSFGTSAAGLTNYRKIGTIKTNASSVFTVTSDPITVHGINGKEVIGGWLHYNGVANQILGSYNVSSVTDVGTAGEFTITWDSDFVSADYVVAGSAREPANNEGMIVSIATGSSVTKGAVTISVVKYDGTATDPSVVTVLAVGDNY